MTVPGPPGPPTASNLSSNTSSNTSGKATLSWAAGTAGTYPVASYKVYQLTRTSKTLIASSTATTLNLSGLTIGESYRYQVVAVDSQGYESLPTSQATVTVPPPVDASCAAHYEISNSWQGGFIAAITLTNRAATPLSDWRLDRGQRRHGQLGIPRRQHRSESHPDSLLHQRHPMLEHLTMMVYPE